MTRTMLQRFWRTLIIVLAVIASLVIPLPPAVLAAVVAAFLAYDGAAPRTSLTVVGVLVAAELAFGVSLGTLSLGAVVAVLLVRLVARVADWVVWSRREGWPLAAFVGAVAAGWAAAAVMMLTGVAVASLVYGAGLFTVRLRVVAGDMQWWALPLVVALVLLLLRRVDVPFRKQLRFGT